MEQKFSHRREHETENVSYNVSVEDKYLYPGGEQIIPLCPDLPKY